MTTIAPFQPVNGSTIIVTPAAGSANSPILLKSQQVRILNTGANIAYIRTYGSLDLATAAVATTADYPIASGQASVISKGVEHDRIAYISAAGTTLQITPGDGW